MSSYGVKKFQSKPDGTYDYITVGTWNPLSLLKLINDIEWNGNKATDGPYQRLTAASNAIGSYRVHVCDQADCCWTCEECPGENVISMGVVHSECKLGTSPNTEKNCTENQISYLS